MFPSGLFCFGSDRKFFFPGGRVKQFRFVSDQLMQGVGNGGAAAIAEHGNLIMGQLINSVIAAEFDHISDGAIGGSATYLPHHPSDFKGAGRKAGIDDPRLKRRLLTV